ncbi:hypothetical protein DCBHLPFO_00649 [Mycoplasmopsis arginini]|uniref:Uncharacterized protein n=1 Tax=Mycoplasmopsis arginini TaxID=2094 RepID=A0AA43U096_MYCAR|nr:hypothetical protein [Mycoplasmopsis arginini]
MPSCVIQCQGSTPPGDVCAKYLLSTMSLHLAVALAFNLGSTFRGVRPFCCLLRLVSLIRLSTVSSSSKTSLRLFGFFASAALTFSSLILARSDSAAICCSSWTFRLFRFVLITGIAAIKGMLNSRISVRL